MIVATNCFIIAMVVAIIAVMMVTVLSSSL